MPACVPIASILPKLLLISTNLLSPFPFPLIAPAASNGCSAWNKAMGPSVLMWKFWRREEGGVERRVENERPWPAHAIMVFMWGIWWVVVRMWWSDWGVWG